MELIPVNAEALKRAMEAVSGPEVATLTLNAYKAIDAAMHFGFQAGLLDARAEATRARFDAEDAAAREEAVKLQESYDNGYCDGVQDARVDPKEADEYLEYLCSLDISEDEFDDLEPKENARVEGADLFDDGGPYNEPPTYNPHTGDNAFWPHEDAQPPVWESYDPSGYEPDPDGGSPWAVDSGDETDHIDWDVIAERRLSQN